MLCVSWESDSNVLTSDVESIGALTPDERSRGVEPKAAQPLVLEAFAF